MTQSPNGSADKGPDLDYLYVEHHAVQFLLLLLLFGLAVVLTLMVFATWNDLVHIGILKFLKGFGT